MRSRPPANSSNILYWQDLTRYDYTVVPSFLPNLEYGTRYQDFYRNLQLHAMPHLNQQYANMAPEPLQLNPSDKIVRYDNRTTRAFLIDAFHTEMILSNLINNAVKYSSEKEIDVTIEEQDGALILEVADGGPLIAEKDRKRIFERFYTVSKSRQKSGFGLGLSIVKHIAVLYDGETAVFENGRGGNTFRVVLREKKGKENLMNPFGANINDILAQSFFLDDGFMGDFAKNKITSLLKWLVHNIGKEWNEDRAEQIIDSLEEPIIKRHLQYLLDIKRLKDEKDFNNR